MTRSADIVIITALEEERDAVLRKLPNRRRQKPSADDVHVYYTCNLPVKFPNRTSGTYRIVVTSLVQMGPTQAATTTITAIHKWKPKFILLVGIAGGVAAAGVRVGDVVISDQVADYQIQKITPRNTQVRWNVHQVDARFIAAAQNLKVTAWQKLITVPRPTKGVPKRHVGPIASGPNVIAYDQVLAKYQSTWPKLIGVEMEAGGAATAAHNSAERPGFFMVRGVSDLADEQKGSASVEKWRAYACDVAAAYAIALLQHGPIPPTVATKKIVAPVKAEASPISQVGTDRSKTSKLEGLLFIPRMKPEYNQRDKDKFLTDVLSQAKRHFQQARRKLQREQNGIEVDVVELSPYKFTASLYVNGEALNRCKIWIGGSFSSNNINYIAGKTISLDQDNSYQEWLKVVEHEGELRMQVGDGLWSEPTIHRGAMLTTGETTQYLWRRFCEPLKQHRSI